VDQSENCLHLYTLKMIKKTAVYHCVNSHASKTAKIIKTGYYPPSRRLHVNVMLSNITL